mgnify:CR=1 FL=1
MLLRARIVLPVGSPPVDNGAVAVADGRLAAVGRWEELSRGAWGGPARDLGEAVLLPGLINAHCHLEYTRMAGGLPPPRHFSDWLKGILAYKAQWSYTEFAESWLEGARQSLAAGITTVADIAAVPELLPDVWPATPLRVFSLLELTNVRNRRPAADIVRESAARVAALPAGRQQAGLSPHAPYSTTPDLLRLAAREARQLGCPLAVHAAESAEEFEMFTQARGRLFDWLRGQRDMSDCGRETPVRRLAALGVLGPNLLAVHVNCLGAGDAELLAAHRASVVHCPRSHAYFNHPRFPFGELARAGVNLCLGTDSLASIRKAGGKLPKLDLFAEMRALADAQPELPPREILRLATVNGARALGREGQLGVLRPGSLADLVAAPFSGPLGQAEDFLVHAEPSPCLVMVEGRDVSGSHP